MLIPCWPEIVLTGTSIQAVDPAGRYSNSASPAAGIQVTAFEVAWKPVMYVAGVLASVGCDCACSRPPAMAVTAPPSV